MHVASEGRIRFWSTAEYSTDSIFYISWSCDCWQDK